ncbi:putative ABC transporter permease [Ruminococcus sp. Marseille-P6503]|uniref:putative ABC transporter permease n=1 Tax=Ruminococcus sp. Marseille-P6503 TaxID=2364796 RepID=UPI000F529B66|nr:putative ABC transporter permease [Ruminococcus sp. Marseille-P6503]
MYEYSFFQWLMFFYIYCFIGWCIESAIVSIDERKFVNRGFLRSPMLPIYGFGAVIILLICLPVRENPVLVYIFGLVETTALEYFTGWLMESLLKMKYWDYSQRKCNLKGRICLRSSLFWGFLSLLLMYVIHKPVEEAVLSMSRALMTAVLSAVTAVFVCDLIYAVRTALDVNKLLAKITDIKAELAKSREELSARFEESERAAAISEKIEKLKADMQRLTERIGFFKKDFILAHPTARSAKFNEALSEIRERLQKKKK